MTWLIFIPSFHPGNSGSESSKPVLFVLVSISSLWLFYKENCKYVSCVSIKSSPVNTTVGWPKRIRHSTRIVDTIFTLFKSMCTLQQDIQVPVSYNKKIILFSLKIVELCNTIVLGVIDFVQSPLLMTFKSSWLVSNYNENHFH